MSDLRPPSQSRQQRQRIARIVLAIALALLGAYVLQSFLRALAWAAILAVATWPLYQRARSRVPAGPHNILLPFLFTLAVVLLFGVPLALAGIQLGHEARNVAGIVMDAREHGISEPELVRTLPFFQPQVSNWWRANLTDPAAARELLGRMDRDAIQTGREFGTQLLHRAILFGFTVLTLFFLFRDGERLTAQALVASNRLFGPNGMMLAQQIVASIRGTVDGVVLVGLGVGVLLGIAYFIAGAPHPVLLGAGTAVAAVVPMGAPAVIAIACLLLLAGGSTAAAIAVAVFGMVVVFVADHAVRPALIGGSTKLPFIWVLLGLLGGIETFGLLGLFLGPAVMAALILLWRDWTTDTTTIQVHS